MTGAMDEQLNLLLVDDQTGKLLTYQSILEELNENLLTASSAKDALGLLLKYDVALILIDVCMPEMDGFELAALIREHPRYRKIAIIFVSALQITDLDRLRGYEAGAVDYVPVPVVPEVLRAKVRVFTELFRKTRALERINAELEARVAERTAALEASSQHLRQLNRELETRVEEQSKQREAALAQLFEAQKMETVGQLTGGVAHDFNNLLMAISGSLELLRKRLSGDERSAVLLNNALQGVERGTALTQRLLAFARRQELRPQIVDACALVHQMRELLERAVGPGVRIALDVPPALPAICVDSNQLELAILNLAVNARDAMPSGGCLTIRLGLDDGGEKHLPTGQRRIFVGVEDTGVGMDQATLARATQPFFTTKGPGKGTGLGLSMVYGLAAQSGGELKIDSEPGRGTRVLVFLPLAGKDSAPQPRVASAPAPVQSSPLSILLVDDDPLVLVGTSAMLEDLGHSVTSATCPMEALTCLETGAAPDVIVTDYAMPGMSGLDLARRIKGRWPNMPVIIASGYADLDGQNLEGFDRLAKPFRQAEVASLLARLSAEPGRSVIALATR